MYLFITDSQHAVVTETNFRQIAPSGYSLKSSLSTPENLAPCTAKQHKSKKKCLHSISLRRRKQKFRCLNQWLLCSFVEFLRQDLDFHIFIYIIFGPSSLYLIVLKVESQTGNMGSLSLVYHATKVPSRTPTVDATVMLHVWHFLILTSFPVWSPSCIWLSVNFPVWLCLCTYTYARKAVIIAFSLLTISTVMDNTNTIYAAHTGLCIISFELNQSTGQWLIKCSL